MTTIVFLFAGDCPFVNFTASFGCDLSDGAALIRWHNTCLNGTWCTWPASVAGDTFAAPLASSFGIRVIHDISGGTDLGRTSTGIFTGDLRSTSAAVAGTPPGATAAEFCGGRPTA